MVGIVVVSHSRALARAAVALAREMVHDAAVEIHVAAGLDDSTFGTDAVQILEAITRADGGDGVVVLMDMGSAILSAELALDLMDDDARNRVTLSAAPLVEGLIVAAVSASSAAGRGEVAAEAAGALAGKLAHLGPAANAGPVADLAVDLAATADGGLGGDPALVGDFEGEPVEAVFSVLNPHGLHARPAAVLVQAVRGLDARVQLTNLTTGAGPVPASSLSRVATLGALRGHQVRVHATGSQAREAADHLLGLAQRAFGEAVDHSAGTTGVQDTGTGSGPTAGTPSHNGSGTRTKAGTVSAVENAGDGRDPSGLHRWEPVPVSPGIGIGPATTLTATVLAIPQEPAQDPRGEWRSLREAMAAVRREIQRVRAGTAREVGETEAAIFDAHLLMLDDPETLDAVHARIDAGRPAAAAWAEVIEGVRSQLAQIADPYLRARAADVEAVGSQVLRSLLGQQAAMAPVEGVLIAADLTPAEAAGLDRDRVAGIVLAFGSPTAHSAILARARGIPAVVGAGPAVLAVAAGTVVALDGHTGEVCVDPSSATLAQFQGRAEELARRRGAALAQAAAPAVTRDGVSVLVAANLGSVEDARQAVANGADLAGLVRTEFLFLDRAVAPGVDEQEATYRGIAEVLDGRRCTFRTLDVGGDKPLGYVPMPAEANPFLGVRGIRLCLEQPQLLIDQLLAIVRVAHDHPVDLMFPMVSSPDELFAARAMLDDAVKTVGRGQPADLRVGIMVEVPAAALKITRFAPHIDFISIGTNDLTQYTLAAERGNQALSRLGDPLDPGVLRLIETVCAGAGSAAVAVCGEIAAEESAASVLVGLGVRELSVSPPAIPLVKETVRTLDLSRAQRLARSALDVDNAAAVRRLLAQSDRT
jgi:phosphoenolpyruvate-protein phosphotransferase/dihydroxyacetone kinase phosphotransfer subunit